MLAVCELLRPFQIIDRFFHLNQSLLTFVKFIRNYINIYNLKLVPLDKP
jgi:hypothetical protein